MIDDWEDWENHEFIVPEKNKEQLQILEERRLIEESDNHLTKDLFCNEEDLLLLKQEDIKPLQIYEKKTPKQKMVSKQKINEEKQKTLSKINKQKKLNKEIEKELFGEAESDEYNKYLEYEELFY
jgi:hypothetical protein